MSCVKINQSLINGDDDGRSWMSTYGWASHGVIASSIERPAELCYLACRLVNRNNITGFFFFFCLKRETPIKNEQTKEHNTNTNISAYITWDVISLGVWDRV